MFPPSQVKGMTPLSIRKAMASAFRPKGSKSSTYKLMKKQDETIDRDQSKSKTGPTMKVTALSTPGVKVTTPLKAKDKLGRSPRNVK